MRLKQYSNEQTKNKIKFWRSMWIIFMVIFISFLLIGFFGSLAMIMVLNILLIPIIYIMIISNQEKNKHLMILEIRNSRGK
jgi:hypothetical protein